MTQIQTQKPTGTKAVASFLQQENVLNKFKDILGTKAQGFIASAISAVNTNGLLKEATTETVYTCLLTAAALDLPVNPNLGFAYLIPFKNNKLGITECQFQIGYKGIIQLAQRSGQYLTIDAKPVYEGQYVADPNNFSGFTFNWGYRTSDKVIGYAAYFKLLNGFEKILYMTAEDLNKHGVKYSQSMKKGYGLWVDNFDAMATKTVLKLLLQKYGPLTIELQKAVLADQSVVKIDEAGQETYQYIDNTPVTAVEAANEANEAKILDFISKANTQDELEMIQDEVFNEATQASYEAKLKTLQK